MLLSRDFKSVSSFDSMVDINKYMRCKDFYCYLYKGSSTEYIFILNYLKNHFIQKFPDITIKVCCKQSLINKLYNYNKEFILPIESTDLSEFGYVEEIITNFNSIEHPLEKIINMLTVNNLFYINKTIKPKTAKIYSNGILPTKSLTQKEISFLTKMISEKNIQLIDNDDDVDWAIGVDNYEIYHHASKGLKTTLVNSDMSKKLINRLFDGMEFYNFGHK